MANNVDFALLPVEKPTSLGLSVLVDPEHAAVDIVFVHGFTGHPERTWTHAGVPIRLEESHNDEQPRKFQRVINKAKTIRRTDTRTPVYWPRDLVPQSISDARTLTYGYDTHIRHRFGAPISNNTVYDIAKDFLVRLDALRQSCPARPVLFIAHSLGGIVVKEMLRQSHIHTSHHVHLRQISNSTVGVIFFGTPHGGSDPRGLLRDVAESLARALGFRVNEQILENLLPSSGHLRQLRDEFGPMAHEQKWKVHSFQEGYGIGLLDGRKASNKVVEDVASCLNDVIEMTEHIVNDHKEMCRFSGLHDPEYGKVVAAIKRILAKATSHDPPHGKHSLDIEKRRRYLEAFKFDHIDSRHATIKAAHGATCQWLLQKHEYRDWLDSTKLHDHNGFLWIKGKPGTGKSTIMKFAVANAHRTLPETRVISFFFNARGEELEKSTSGMYRSLLTQLLENIPETQVVLDALGPPPLTSGLRVSDWSVERLKDLFRDAIQRLKSWKVVCFIDALDECPEDAVRDMIRFFENLGEENAASQRRFHVCFSSRHYPNISIEKAASLVLEDQQGHGRDLEIYVHSQMKCGKSRLVGEIKNEILQRASGIFLWVVLVVGILNTEYDRGKKHALRKRLDEIPDGLDELFKDIITRDGRNLDDLLLCLQWILYAKRPLKREELYFAILAGSDLGWLTAWDPEDYTTDDMEKFILDSSKGLAELTKATKNKAQTVQFIHESVRDFLLKENGLRHLQSDIPEDPSSASHHRLWICCQNYIDMCVYPEGPPSDDGRITLEENFPFVGYAAGYIFDHAELALVDEQQQDAFVREWHHSREPDRRSFSLLRWIEIYNILERYNIRRYSESASLLYIFAEKNLPNLIQAELRRQPHMDIEGERYCFPLTAAVAHSNKAAIHAFLTPTIKAPAYWSFAPPLPETTDREIAADLLLESRTKISTWKHPLLFWAVAAGEIGLMHTLLATKKVDPDLPPTITMVGHPGPNFKATMSLVLTDDGNPLVGLTIRPVSEHLTFCVKTILSNGHGVLARMLLVHWCTNELDINHVGSQVHDKVECPLRSMLDDDGLVSFLDLLGRFHTPQANHDYIPRLFFYACKRGLESLVEVLIKRPEINSSGSIIVNGSKIAAENGKCSVVRSILNGRSADLITDVNAEELLASASRCGQSDVVQLLLDRGVDVNTRKFWGAPPLLEAIHYSQEDVVRLLLSRPDVNVNARNRMGITALRMAETGLCLKTFEMLLERDDIDLHAGDTERGHRLLQRALERGHSKVVELLEKKIAAQAATANATPGLTGPPPEEEMLTSSSRDSATF